MKTVIRKMGNSQGVLIPKLFLEQTGFDLGEVELQVEDHAIVIRKPARKARAGWAQASQKLARVGDDKLVWPEFANEGDQDLQW